LLTSSSLLQAEKKRDFVKLSSTITTMAARQQYHRVDSEPNTPITAESTEVVSAWQNAANPDTRPIVRRYQPEKTLPVKAMSLVGLKSIFFRQTLSPDWTSTNRRRGMLSPDPRQPLLPNQLTTTLEEDVESQDSEDSKAEKTSKKKGFKIDGKVINDATLGLSDGLTVPFALTAGLSAFGKTNVVIYGGFAELIAGAISMGLGGYLGEKAEADAFAALREKTEELIATNPQEIMADVAAVFEPYNLPKNTINDITQHLAKSPNLADFVMQFQHGESEPESSRAVSSAITIAAAYFLGGILPLIPYLCVGENEVFVGLYISVVVMIAVLFVFGFCKTCIVREGWWDGESIRKGLWGGLQMIVLGVCCAGAAMGLVRLFHDASGESSG
jgi:VIT1/CCC1 family predicted Fe2+/Mn2+ transporter